ncbi:diguanylate cyclase (GGDEF)-like protein [Desulfomicrobium macestii]|uniref:diguanylate cyclase n=1 Tax=Desulfomicrobium macestii TaxID=90731 RepID=A0ABR9H8L7_9BACT|nr:diguanylate cyclase [Desulfomicrobium macestii]MBE1427071.1 diguanylate cyclase (GGDEF)-like protein [Desulfomicrobium macestii]
MKKPHWTAFCLTLLCLALLPAPVAGRASDSSLNEREYLDTLGPVTLCVDPDWAPFEQVDDQGTYRGIAADLLALVSERSGVHFELLRTKDWDESLELSRQGKCLALSFLNQTPTRDEWLLFTEPLFSDPNVFITREEHPFISDPAELDGETIVFPRGTAMEERIRAAYPNLKVLVTATEAEAMDMVSTRKADMTMRSLIVAAYTIRKEGLFNLKIAGKFPDYENLLRIGVSRQEPRLRDILSRAVASIGPTERGRIANEHVSINVHAGTDYRLLARVAAGSFAVIALMLAWAWQLRRHNHELARISRTDALTGLANRMAIMEALDSELQRAHRYGRPLSIAMLDLDHFKMINDGHGHLAGDRVLKQVGNILARMVRTTDTAGRWGGEEFLALFPESDPDHALEASERIRKSMHETDFGSVGRCTISIGVASYVPGDSADTLLQRADTALYQAKKQGRDRTVRG